jgi:hypothetical protein
MICGFERGDIQVFEIQRKWERVSHLHKCHQSRVVMVEFFHKQEGKIDVYDAISVDDQGTVIRM